MWTALRTLYPVSVAVDDVVARSGSDRDSLDPEFLSSELVADALAAYERREQELGSEVMREIERQVVLSVLDRKWREHLYEMDYLREGIGLRAMAQRDPLVEYQREGYDLFVAMMDAIKEETVGYVFYAEVVVNEQPTSQQEQEQPQESSEVNVRGFGSNVPTALEYSAPSETGGATTTFVSSAEAAAYKNVSRNDPCPCGSGKKFKRCHGDPTRA